MIRSGKPGARRPAATSVRPPVLLIFAITVTGILNNTLIGPSIPDILDDLGRSESGAGFIVAAGSLPGVVVAPIIGLLADRYGRRRVLTPCLLAFAGFGLVAASAPTFEVLVGARLLQGFGTAGLINLAVVLISDHWDGEQRTALIGRNAAVLTLALALAPSIGGVIADLAHWRVALMLYGVGVPAAAAVWRLLPEDRPETSVQVRDQLRDAGVALREPVVLATLGLAVMVRVSARTSTSQEANQLGGAVILPLIFLAVGQSTGLLLVDWPVAIGIGGAIWLIALLLLRGGIRRFTRDALVSQVG